MSGACPTCGRENNAHTGVTGDDPPVAGAATICLACASWAVFTPTDGGGLALRLPTNDELAQIRRSPDAQAAEEAITVAAAKRRRRW